MSREILFRGKRLDNGKWIEGDGIHYPKSINYLGSCWIDGMGECANDWVQVDPATIGQFTGFCDKHGVRIFEGDKFRDPAGDTYTVKWEESSGAWEFFSKDRSFLFIMRCLDMFEVIGNIYDKEEQDALQGKFAQEQEG